MSQVSEKQEETKANKPKANKPKSSKKEKLPSLRVGDRVRITDKKATIELNGKKVDLYGAAGTVRDVSYKNFEEAQKAASGIPEHADYAEVDRIHIVTRGGTHARISLKPSQVKKIRTLGTDSSDL